MSPPMRERKAGEVHPPFKVFKGIFEYLESLMKIGLAGSDLRAIIEN